jgi:hypothetical protein
MNNMDEKNVDITTSSSIIPSKPTRKVNRRSNVNEDDKEKITEKVEGGIIVRRYAGKKIEI